MKDTVRLPRVTKPAPPAALSPCGSPKPAGKDTVRLDRPAGKQPARTGATLKNYLHQQKPHVEPPPQ